LPAGKTKPAGYISALFTPVGLRREKTPGRRLSYSVVNRKINFVVDFYFLTLFCAFWSKAACRFKSALPSNPIIPATKNPKFEALSNFNFSF